MLKFQKRAKQDVSSVIKDVASSLDFFGQPPYFRILKHQKFNTLLGRCLTLLLILLCSLYLYFSFSELLSQRTPNIIISETQPQNTPAFQLNLNNFTFALSVTDISLKALSTYKKHFNVSMQACNRTRFFNETTQATQIIMTCLDVPLETCDLEKHFPEEYQKQYFAKFRLKNMFCIEKDSIEKKPPQLQGFTNADTYQFLQVSVMPCTNSTDFQGCSPQEEITKALSNGYYAVYLADNLVKLDNPGRPYEDIINIQFISLASSSSKQLYSTFRMVETKTDIGLIQQQFKSELCLIQSTTRDFQGSYNNQYYVQNLIFMEQRVNNYQRSYIKVQNILGNVGGLWQLITLAISTLVAPVIAMLMNLQIANRMFNFENQNRKSRDDNRSVMISVGNLNNVSQCQQNNYVSQLENNNNYEKDIEKIQNRVQLKKYLKQKKKSLQLGLWDLFCMNIGFKKTYKQQIVYAVEKILTKLDVVNILTKIQEIDKLKYILLNKEQLQLFNYIPKPLIPQDMFASDFEQKLNQLESKTEFQFILQEEKPDLFKVEQAFYAYMKLQQKDILTEIDRNILELVGEDMITIFDQMNRHQEDFLVQSNRFIHSNLNLLEQPHIQILSPYSIKQDDIIVSRNDNKIQDSDEDQEIEQSAQVIEEQSAQIPPKVPSKKNQ